jgi:hypothetical protein
MEGKEEKRVEKIEVVLLLILLKYGLINLPNLISDLTYTDVHEKRSSIGCIIAISLSILHLNYT